LTSYIIWSIIIIISLVLGVAVGYLLRRMVSQKEVASAESLAARILGEAKKEAENIKKESLLQAKDNMIKVKTDLEKESKEKKESGRQIRPLQHVQVVYGLKPLAASGARIELARTTRAVYLYCQSQNAFQILPTVVVPMVIL